MSLTTRWHSYEFDPSWVYFSPNNLDIILKLESNSSSLVFSDAPARVVEILPKAPYLGSVLSQTSLPLWRGLLVGGDGGDGDTLVAPAHCTLILGLLAKLRWHGAGAAVSMVTSHLSFTRFAQCYQAPIQTDAKPEHLKKYYTVSPFPLLCRLV